MLTLLLACTSEAPLDSGPCVSHRAVVTDIDETLTTSDDEWISQMGDADHDPAMRPAANTLFNAYADAGYEIFYVTARGEDFAMSDGRTAREATSDWLVAHDFPFVDERLYLSDGFGVAGDDAAAYKSAVLAELETAGWTHEWAYGNADSDIAAFKTALELDRIFLVGELAGTLDVLPITDEDAFEAHIDAQLPQVESTECAL
ncbi:MAG: hypothetical protein GY913_14855 [Proteobacteria bacterium]|nr:hypothetical protein [Pseudomonadota bacterium]MCP4918190.1 hypothetical protein [Pseudomonadota bacterium]